MTGRDTQRPRSSLRDTASAGGLMTPVYTLIERGINDALHYDPATRQRIAAHAGRVLAIDCRQPPLAAYFLFTAEGTVELYDSCETVVDATIRAGALGLLRQLAAERPDIAPPGSGIEVAGDTRFVQDIVRVARDIDIDWEEPLARVLGDIAARQVGELVRGAASFLTRAATSLRRNGEDFLRHETGAFPSKHAMREFLQDIDDLRLDVDRAEARVSTLHERIARHASAAAGTRKD